MVQAATGIESLILEKLTEISEDITDLKADVSDLKADVTEIKISQARTDERLHALNDKFDQFKAETAIKFSDLKEESKIIRGDIKDVRAEIKDVRVEVKGQDARLWGFVVALFLSLTGVIVKVVFFPQG